MSQSKERIKASAHRPKGTGALAESTPTSAPPFQLNPSQVKSGIMGPAGVLGLQRAIGNRALQGLLRHSDIESIGLQTQRAGRRPPSASQSAAGRVRTALSQTPPDYTNAPSPPDTEGGAFYVLNGLNPSDIIDALRALSRAQRNLLLSNVHLAEGLFDRPRLELAIKASLAPNPDNGVKAVSMLDAIRNAGGGSFAPVFAHLQGLPRARVRAILGLFELSTAQLILSRIGDALPASRDLFTQTLQTLVHATYAQRIQAALAMTPPDFVSNPSLALPVRSQSPHGGAYYILNGLKPSDMIGVLAQLTSAQRTSLFQNVTLTQGLYDRPRLELAIKASMTEGRALGIQAVTLLDAIRNASGGSLAAAFTHIQAVPRTDLLDILSLFDRANLQLMQMRIATDAPPASRQRLTEVFADVLGAPAMRADDLIDLASIRGVQNRRMASMYNRYGQLLFHHAQTNNFATDILAGVMSVEAGGRAFDAGTDKAIIRFEAHVFWDRWGRLAANRAAFNQHFDFNRTGDRTLNHRFRENPTDPWQNFHGNQQRERQALALATRLANAETANQCMSIGSGQVMGFNFARLGFATASDMVTSFDASERAQIEGMVNFFLNTPGLPAAIRARNFNQIARLYNGAGRVAIYAPRIQAAAQAYQGVTNGRRFVHP
ncbi:MAG: DUF3380 domain-containing protein [Caldilineaceae bacterium]|nr:DUF3380 domain-containing protein [Caldilineaceae bacterium]